MPTSASKAPLTMDTQPWWRYGHLWLVIAGPVLAVVVGMAMLAAALALPDPVVAADYYRRGMEINKTLAEKARNQMPAQQGRNHAATPEPAAPEKP